ncbi:hypothetical protein EDC56_2864 [Sinobacterium caligoides]|uniref:Uncharacterized protein n=1 Tax=Sinobacterium caligoides TaxID=933926 RepID=A0A3N2DK99_9GAMM|nr:hypothetical protein [Sinobacterium caligoides]ROS00226.1 hypothetical protein EDC56_2864 [Sinobacterium caligoides]
MTPENTPSPAIDASGLVALRNNLALSSEAMASTLGLSDEQLVAIEAGQQPISDSVAAIASYLLIPQLLQQQGFPQFTMGDDARVENKHAIDYVYHNWYPRFIGMMTQSEAIAEDSTHIAINDDEALVIVTWIDSPMAVEYQQLESILLEAAKQLQAYYQDIDLNLNGV